MVEADQAHILPLILSHSPPRKSPTPPHGHEHTSDFIHGTAPSLPLIPAATKLEQYGHRLRYDRCVLQRPQAHFRHALKTTQPIEAVLKRLNKVRDKSFI